MNKQGVSFFFFFDECKLNNKDRNDGFGMTQSCALDLRRRKFMNIRMARQELVSPYETNCKD